MKLQQLLILSLSMCTSSVLAEKFDTDIYSTSLDFAQVTHVEATQRSSGSWCFDTSVRHNDEGWEHYADRWEVLDLQGKQLGFRSLGHPHVNEQPFTRSRCGIEIPSETSEVVVRAKCNKHGYGGEPVIVDLSNSQGDAYTVNRSN